MSGETRLQILLALFALLLAGCFYGLAAQEDVKLAELMKGVGR